MGENAFGPTAIRLVDAPVDWPGPGPIDLAVQDLPHASSTTEWWYLNGHLDLGRGRTVGVFASFFRILSGEHPDTKAPIHAHSLTWAVSDTARSRYLFDSRVDTSAPKHGLEKIKRGQGSRDPRIQHAMKEVLERGQVPQPDRFFAAPVLVSKGRLDLDFGGNRFWKLDDGRYRLELKDGPEGTAVDLTLTPRCTAVRHGTDGVVKGRAGEDMFYYFLPRCDVSGQVWLDGRRKRVRGGKAWYDHEFGAHSILDADAMGQDPAPPVAGEPPAAVANDDMAWNWLAAQLKDGSQLTAYTMEDLAGQAPIDACAVLIDADGTVTRFPELELTPDPNSWTSARTFNRYPLAWTLSVPAADLELRIEACFADQEFVTLISKPAFWEGRCLVQGTRGKRRLTGQAYVERSGYFTTDTLDKFFKSVSREVRRSIRKVLPIERPSYNALRDLVSGEHRDHFMEGVDHDQLVEGYLKPLREITDRGGKAWRSYAALACCDIVGGDSRDYVKWLAMPELMHVGSLIVDDVQDKSDWRRGGPACHLVYGEALAINSGTAGYFIGQQLLQNPDLSSAETVRVYELYFEALRAGHAGQALDLLGPMDAVPGAVETGRIDFLEQRVLAIHRLKTAAPAAALARMGAIAGKGSEEQIDGVGRYFESLGLAFQIIDDVLNLRGFKGNLKERGEDIRQGKITLPVVKAMRVLSPDDRAWLADTVCACPQDQAVVNDVIARLEEIGAIDDCVEQAEGLVEDAWRQLDPLVDDSLSKVMLRAFGWYVLQRHY